MAKLIYSFRSGGSMTVWDTILPTKLGDAVSLMVGDMCLDGHISAVPFSSEDRGILRQLFSLKEVDLPTPSLKITNPRRSPQGDTPIFHQPGGCYHATIVVCIYGLGEPKEHLGVYEIELRYVPATTIEPNPSFDLKYDSRLVRSVSDDHTEAFVFPVVTATRDQLLQDGGLVKFLDFAKSSPLFTEAKKHRNQIVASVA